MSIWNQPARWRHVMMWSLLAACMLVGASPAAPARAAGITIDPAVIDASVTPGQTQRYSISVTSDEPANLTVSVKGLGQSPDGGYRMLDVDVPFSAKPMITVSPASLTVDRTGPKRVDVTVAVPAGTPAGGLYGLVVFETPAPAADATGGSLRGRVSSTVVVTLAGASQQRTGEIADIKLADHVQGQPMTAVTTLKNTGNYHYKAVARASLKDASGTLLGAGASALSPVSVIPSYSLELRTPLQVSRDLPIGNYVVEVTVVREDGTVLATRSYQASLVQQISAPSLGGVTSSTVAPRPISQAAEAPISLDPFLASLLLVGLLTGVGLLIQSRRSGRAEGQEQA